MSKPRIGDKLVLIALFDDTEAYLKCTFRKHLSDQMETGKSVLLIIDVLGELRSEAHKAFEKKRGFSRSLIGKFGKASTRLYHATRKMEIELDCDETWQRLGFCAHMLF
jgi:hypothetical protein